MASTISAGTTAGTAIVVSGDTSGSLALQTNGTTTAVTIDTSQNVGIGTASPNALLHLSKNSGSVDLRMSVGGTLYVNMYASASDTTINNVAATPLTLGTSNTERMRIDSSGNVGIGTASPDALLTVNTIASFGDGAVGTPSIAHKGDLNTGVWFPAADTIAASTGGTERMRIDSAGLLKFNSGYGSAATAYGCRAWVDFNGTGTVAINGSGNVSSITDNGTGDYTVNFTTALVDANYSAVTGGAPVNGNEMCTLGLNYSTPTKTSSAMRFASKTQGIGITDTSDGTIAFFR